MAVSRSTSVPWDVRLFHSLSGIVADTPIPAPRLLSELQPFVSEIYQGLPSARDIGPSPDIEITVAKACWAFIKQRAVPFAHWLEHNGAQLDRTQLASLLAPWAAVGGGLKVDGSWDLLMASVAVKWLSQELLGPVHGSIGVETLLGFLHPNSLATTPMRADHVQALVPFLEYVNAPLALKAVRSSKSTIRPSARIAHRSGLWRYIGGNIQNEITALEVLEKVEEELKVLIIGGTPQVKTMERSPTLPGGWKY
ncbi:hypothetical protein HDU93_007038 [Gonapodya sp. JEL0774]|nr:hypothetical protein HDU93_007038 [Gonapodya sp. JEL0774]